MKKNMTIKDVAEKCGVSTQTISRVINESENVSENTRQFVKKKIEELGYKPNLYAKNLSNRKTKNILVSIRRSKGHTATIWTNILVSEIFAYNKDKNVSLFMEQYYNDEDLKNSLLNTSNTFIDGVVIFYEKEKDKRIEILKKEKIPFIVLGKSYSEENIYVSNDDFNSVFKATEYLFRKNIENIVFITANPTPMNIERKNGIIEAYRNNNKSLKNLRVMEKMKNQKEIYKLVKELENKKSLPEAFFVSGDEKAIAVLKALNDLKIRIPDEVSVLGLDNIPISEFFSPGLTTLALNYKKISERVYEKLINMINGIKEYSEEIPGEIVERESVRK
ncbi:LacI family DNA-binding transcriptional regulator [Pseudoleptotrichia goodfellowii]|uniref:Transcriptional regulator, LacI family n=1 Tax=Pseudoleptotrichia goodfellowii TaxID=157692 RepID=A0A510JA01_9FUSO|nr:LacI family DNA-binding transcriptional regulator [Pseudoleptotrichia goodfellowii]BBM35984.1 transcriptional regulator, LacI family [Pseudoleptotrichia goodfellowii]